jgi:hypothetical protein
MARPKHARSQRKSTHLPKRGNLGSSSVKGIEAKRLAGRPAADSQYANAAIEAAFTAFLRDLPQLLRTNPGKWIAYLCDKMFAIGADDFKLYEMCRLRGIPLNEFIVECIEPQTGNAMFMGPGFME